MREYIEINKWAYETLAFEYNEKWKKYVPAEKQVLKPLENCLKKDFKNSIMVLDVGCGVGLDSYILSEAGFEVRGLDISPKMIEYAKKNAPKATFSVGDFLEAKFEDKFHGIILSAFIHLFPKKDTLEVLEKAKSLLVPGGYGIISTTQNAESKEGYYEKSEYSKKIKRFRKFWVKKELLDVLENSGLKVVSTYSNADPVFNNKSWITLTFRREK